METSISFDCRALAILLLLGACEPAPAAGFQPIEQNASGLGTVYAGQAALAEDASAIYFNPAGLARLEGRGQVVGALHRISSRSTFRDTGSCAPYVGAGVGTMACPFGAGGNLGHAVGGDGGTVTENSPLPNVYAAWRSPVPDLWFGIGINFPFGLKSEREATWVGRFHSTASETQAVNINPTVAWKLSDAVSMGAGLNAQRFSAKLSNAVSYRAIALASGVGPLIAAIPPGSEGVATVHGNDWGFGWNAGVGVRPIHGVDLDLGLAYRSAVRYKFKGDVRFDNRPAALGSVPQVADGPVRADIELPDTLSLAVAWRPVSKTLLLLDWTRTGWSSVQDLAIVRDGGPLAGQTLSSTPLRFRNSWRAGLGVVREVGLHWKVRAGLAYETSPVTDMFRTPRLADAKRNLFGIGAQWSPSAAWAFDAGFAWVRLRNAPTALANQDTAKTSPAGSLVGNFSGSARIVGAQVTRTF